MSAIRESLQELGLGSYTDRLIAEGFDTWETLCDITESDLNDLKFKLGHRRKLQRAFAQRSRQNDNQRAPPPQAHLFDEGEGVAPPRQSVESIPSQNVKSSNSSEEPVRTKRKYRRHPKPDVHAPERPPSAYVIFSNHMRELLKDKDHSFTEMAKCVGERWQELLPDERERFERQASMVKETYLAQLSEYKKLDNYKTYQEYLVEFKAKNGRNDNESKRAKLHAESSASTQSSHDTSELGLVSRTKSGGSTYTAASTPPEIEPLSEFEYKSSSSPKSFYPKIQHPEKRAPRYTSVLQSNLAPTLLTLPYDREPPEMGYGKITPFAKIEHSPYTDWRSINHPEVQVPCAVRCESFARLPPLADAKIHPRALPINTPSYTHSKFENQTSPLPGIMDFDPARSRRVLPTPVRTSIAGGHTVLRDRSPASGITSPLSTTPVSRRPVSMASTGSASSSNLPGVDDARANASLATLLRAGEELAARDEDIRTATDCDRARPP